ncbi:adhesion G protein-coupled receptor B1-like isoform X2 [Actinia tenebrosa]|uniref:Adhesion G protein-coupled receptor B1-like isoform X1 n=1 Tax=Actinia tenebrosa TaxID=6105 RepID=A0A6P8ITE2_ACTTE|nr:adhesion G protein-coupled receptor B1-like isoform X1 [Actinia tenebrosa]XP_031569458.1 adhesion G protein-coupled receptor B1-like isoform X2 [Actinia tenebrosa]
MKLLLIAVVVFLLCGIMLPTSFAESAVERLRRMRCRNAWNCKRCYEIKRQGRCNGPYKMGVCYKTCTGCGGYIDTPEYDCPSIFKQGKCFSNTINNPYIVYAQRCEVSCCQAYPLDIPTKAPSIISKLTKPTTAPLPKIIWNQWSSWNSCSKTCHIGYQKRNRTCSFSSDPKVNCNRPQIQYRYCNNNISCQVAGGFSEWSKWSVCPFTCGVIGKQTRTRTCTNPPPQNGGPDCVGPSSETKECNLGCCPEAGDWSQWSAWSSCSKTCCSSNGDNGIRKRTRSCTNPAPFCGAGPCIGSYRETKPCLPLPPCVNPTTIPSPYWSSWGPWGPCSATCYVGYRERRRACIGYQGYNKYCHGRFTQFESCNTHILC